MKINEGNATLEIDVNNREVNGDPKNGEVSGDGFKDAIKVGLEDL